MIKHSHSTNDNTFHFLKDNLWKNIRLLTTKMSKPPSYLEKTAVEMILHTTPKKKTLALTHGDCLQGDKVIYFPNLGSFKFLSSPAIFLQVIFGGPNSYQSFNLSRALCNGVCRLWVELFLLRNWALHAEKPLGDAEGQPGRCECRRELSQKKVYVKHSYICIWRV